MTETNRDYDTQIMYLLKELIPAIEDIDGGCGHCISVFIKDINAILQKNNIPFRYGWSAEEQDDIVLLRTI